MVCGGCVQKLALRLMRNHKIDFVEALVRAEKGIERFENREKPKILSGKGNPSDYSQSCSVSGSCSCADASCLGRPYPNCAPITTGCVSSNTCSCGCPSPLPDSHYVSDDCVSGNTCYCDCRRVIPLMICICGAYGSCSCGGACYYDCDAGYYWNGVACVLPTQAGLHPSKVVPLIITD